MAILTPATAPTPDHPDAALLAYEAELEALVVEWQILDDAWPGRGASVVPRWNFHRVSAAFPRVGGDGVVPADVNKRMSFMGPHVLAM